MNRNEQTIHAFYKAFANKDYATMQSCYADDAVFSDPVFTDLDALHVKAMWEMLCKKGKDLDVVYSNVTANETEGRAVWEATYTFSATGKKVVNLVQADFKFRDGKIVYHKDVFDFYKWAKQAFGMAGLLFGWTPFLQNKVRRTAMHNLEAYIKGR